MCNIDKNYGEETDFNGRNVLAKMIDHALLSPEMSDDEIVAGCRLADRYGVASVCVKPFAVRLAADALRESSVEVGTVVSFPHGSCATSIKADETKQAIIDGASEIDMVVNIGKVLSSDWEYVERDIRAVIKAAHSAGNDDAKAVVKVIFENHYLDDEQKIKLCEICTRLGADFVKTSTGFAKSSATIADVKLMREHCPDSIGVKAAGGIRNLEQFLAFKEAGASRIGVSATTKILDEYDSSH